MITPSFSIPSTERVLPKLALDFTTAVLDSRITFTRALDTATRINSSGNLETVISNTPRFDYDPTSLVCKGLLIEEARTNSIKNNTMQGASAGVLPTNWQISAAGGMSISIVGTGIEKGIEYVDVRYFGTSSSTSTSNIQFTQNNEIDASTGQTWTLSAYLRIVGGSLSGLSGFNFGWEERSTIFVGSQVSTALSFSSSALTRQSFTATNSGGATVTKVKPYFRFVPNSGQTIDVTIRIGLPQMELGAFATSVIKTTNAAVTRNADVATMTGTNFSDWYNQTEGSFFVQVNQQSISTTFAGGMLSANDGTSQNYMELVRRASDATIRFTTNVNSVSETFINSGIVTTGVVCAVGAYKLNNFACSSQGRAAVFDTVANVPIVSQLFIGNTTTSKTFANGWIQKINYWPQRMTNSEVQAFSKQG